MYYTYVSMYLCIYIYDEFEEVYLLEPSRERSVRYSSCACKADPGGSITLLRCLMSCFCWDRRLDGSWISCHRDTPNELHTCVCVCVCIYICMHHM